MITHKPFLAWLLVFTVTIFIWGISIYIGLPQLALLYDHSGLTMFLFSIYSICELVLGIMSCKLSKEYTYTNNAKTFLENNILTSIKKLDVNGKQSIVLESGDKEIIIGPSIWADHVSNLIAKNIFEKVTDQTVLLHGVKNKLYKSIGYGSHFLNIVITVGILATIVGVILAFWPMMTVVTVDSISTLLPLFLPGIATAFIPTAISFVMKFFVDNNVFKLKMHNIEVADTIAETCDIYIMPYLRKEHV